MLTKMTDLDKGLLYIMNKNHLLAGKVLKQGLFGTIIISGNKFRKISQTFNRHHNYNRHKWSFKNSRCHRTRNTYIILIAFVKQDKIISKTLKRSILTNFLREQSFRCLKMLTTSLTSNSKKNARKHFYHIDSSKKAITKVIHRSRSQIKP